MDKYTTRTCKHHGDTVYVLEGRGSYRCRQCRMDGVQKRRQAVKQKLVDHFGGACKACGYNRYVGSLQFHHRDPAEKDFGIGETGNTMSFDKALVEAEKCVLVCANCHSEIHAGVIDCP